MYLAVQMVVVQFTTLNNQMVNQQTLASTSPTNIVFKLFSSKNMCMYVCVFLRKNMWSYVLEQESCGF